MTSPDPILDHREREMAKQLHRDYEAFRTPGFIKRTLRPFGTKVREMGHTVMSQIPGARNAQERVVEAINSASTRGVVQDVLAKASEGGSRLLQLCARNTLGQSSIVAKLQEEVEPELDTLNQVCLLRSYEIEPVASTDLMSRGSAFLQGVGTGFLGGLHGLALNLAASMLIFFRATQRVALFYGYDAVARDAERAFAAEVALQSMTNGNVGDDALQGLLGKMMMARESKALRRALSTKTYEEMASRGYSELLYVRIRALANRAAKKALDRAGKSGIDNGLLQRLLESVGRRLPKRAGRRIIPVVSAALGGVIDSYYMDRVLRGANLIYHKRFLMEKEERIRRLNLESEDRDADHRAPDSDAASSAPVDAASSQDPRPPAQGSRDSDQGRVLKWTSYRAEDRLN
jgi:hypothetical protein